MSGEGILSLEAACASLTEPGDRVLVIDNGIFGKGFSDFVSIYGGTPILYTQDYRREIDLEQLEQFLQKNHDFKYATVVHCDTPSGVRNDISQICPLLKQYGILTVVDSVAAMFGEAVYADEWKIDILCGGSQKALSAPPGLAFVTVSETALRMMKARKSPIASFYCNLLIFDGYYEKKWFPYTMPVSDIYGMETAIANIKEDAAMIERHAEIAEAVRKAVLRAGLQLYLKSGYSATVTVIVVPEGVTDQDIICKMKDEYHILIAGSFDVLAGKVIRIGHMGMNASKADVAETLDALGKTLLSLGVYLKADMKEAFLGECRNCYVK